MTKIKLIRWICILTALCILGLILMGAASDTESASVKKLLEKRTAIMDNVLSGNITYEEGAGQLKRIEAGKLYNDDLQSMKKYMNTDIETVKEMEVIDIKKESQIYGTMTFSCEIRWVYEGINGTDEMICEYTAGVDRNGGDFRLVSFTAVWSEAKQ